MKSYYFFFIEIPTAFTKLLSIFHIQNFRWSVNQSNKIWNVILFSSLYCQWINNNSIEMRKQVSRNGNFYLTTQKFQWTINYPHHFLNSSQIRHKSLPTYVKLSLESCPRYFGMYGKHNEISILILIVGRLRVFNQSAEKPKSLDSLRELGSWVRE